MTEECEHSKLEVAVIVLQCQECGHRIINRVKTSHDRFTKPVKDILQGTIDAKFVIDNAEWPDTQKAVLLAIVPCKHPAERIVDYVCNCSGGRRWRCKDCGLSADTVGTFERLRIREVD